MGAKSSVTHRVRVPFRAAVIGAGAISEPHLGFIRDSDSADLVAVCDLSPTIARYTARRYGAPQSFDDHTDLLAAVQPDVVHILTPPQTHGILARDALSAGCHVIVEKPIALTSEEFSALHALALARGVVLTEDHNYRFNRPIRKLTEIVNQGMLGRVHYVDVEISAPQYLASTRYNDRRYPSSSHQLPAGFIHEFITHLAYLTLLFMPTIDSVTSRWTRTDEGCLSPFDGLDASVEGGDATGRIRFISTCYGSSIRVRVRGTAGEAEASVSPPALRLNTLRSVGSQLSPFYCQLQDGLIGARSAIGGVAERLLGKGGYEGVGVFLSDTYASIASGLDAPVRTSEIAASLQLIDQLIQGMQS